MKKIIKKRGQGKTTDLIRLCAENGGYIVCRSSMTREIHKQAKEMGLSIPFPISHHEFLSGRYNSRGVVKVYIEVDDDLVSYAAGGVAVEVITMTEPEDN